MPDRIVRAGILTSDGVNSLSWAAEVFYRRLMNVVDDFGRYDGRLSVLRGALYALKIDRVSEPDLGKWILETEEAGLVRRYTVDGKPYLELLKFGQKIRALKSKWPSQPTSADIRQQTPADASVVVDVVVVGIPDSKESGVPGAAGSVPCPHEKVISLYHELLPSNPRIVAWNTARQGYLRSRWREQSKAGKTSEGYQTEEAGIAWWRKFLGWVGQSKFLTGQIEGRDGKPPFLADLEWIVRPRNFVKILEGKYHRG